MILLRLQCYTACDTENEVVLLLTVEVACASAVELIWPNVNRE